MKNLKLGDILCYNTLSCRNDWGVMKISNEHLLNWVKNNMDLLLVMKNPTSLQLLLAGIKE